MPQPPSLNLAKPVSDLKATRTGNDVALTWTVPNETTDHATFRHRGPLRICQAIDQLQISRCQAQVTYSPSKDQKTRTVTVPLPNGSNGPSDYVTYAVEIDNNRGRSAGVSNQVHIPATLVSKITAAPSVELTADAVLVTTSLTQQTPAVTQTLELRRAEKGAPEETTVAQRPLEISSPNENTNVELRDDTFVWEKTYAYRVVVVASANLPSGTVVFDGATSEPLEVFAHDTFPPAIPTGVEAVFSGAIEGQPPSIDLTWNPDSDRDLAGYFIYRRKQDEPDSSAVKLNAQPVTAPAFHDARIQPGNTYVYSVSAIDERGNESKRSEETSEQVPRG